MMNDEGPLEFAHGFDDPRAEEDGWIRIATENAKDANARLALVTEQRDKLRVALVGLVGVDGKDELEHMECVIRLIPAPAQDKAATIDAIHALIATLPASTARE